MKTGKLVRNCILTSCQPQWVTPGQSNSVINTYFITLFISKSFFKSNLHNQTTHKWKETYINIHQCMCNLNNMHSLTCRIKIVIKNSQTYINAHGKVLQGNVLVIKNLNTCIQITINGSTVNKVILVECLDIASHCYSQYTIPFLMHKVWYLVTS